MKKPSLRILGVILVAALGVVSSARAALADPHLPILDISPTANWAAASDARVLPGSQPGLVSGPITLDGTATLPIAKGLSFSYDRINSGPFYNTLTLAPLPGGGTITPGSYDDVVQNYRLDYEIDKSLSAELSESTRQRVCCPAASVSGLDWHIGSFGLTYTTPYFPAIKGLFVINVTGHANYHNPGPVVAASYGGLDVSCSNVTLGTAGPVCNNYKAVTVLESSEAFTYVLPLRGGFVATATFITGAGDYFTAFPFPDRYNILAYNAEKRFTPNIALKMGLINVWQVQQGNPFPPPGAIHLVGITAALDFHLDLNKLLLPQQKK
jgi:hypothetical protein